MALSDFQLLQRYWQRGSEEAFAEVVRRHVDLVYSVAFRHVRSAPLAEEIAQSVFAELGQASSRLQPDSLLCSWLYTVTRRRAIDVIRKESRRQAREQMAATVAVEGLGPAGWKEVEPLLDDAMEALGETDRNAILLRFFEHKKFKEIAWVLGTSEDGAQKRVSRAIDQLRSTFAKRGYSVSSVGLSSMLLAHAVEASPAGLVSIISTTLVLTSPLPAGLVSTISNKILAMTTLHKVVVPTLIATAIGIGLVEESRIQRLRQESASSQLLASQLQDQTRERLALVQKLDEAQLEIEKLREQQDELNRLRAEAAAGMHATPAETQAEETPSPRVSEPPSPMLALGDMGNTTPEAAMQTFLWAARAGDYDRVNALLSVIKDESVSDELADQIAEGTNKSIISTFSNLLGFRIVSQSMMDQGILRMSLEFHTDDARSRVRQVHLIQDGAQWMPAVRISTNRSRSLSVDLLRSDPEHPDVNPEPVVRQAFVPVRATP